MPDPPLSRWEEQGALRELARMAGDLPRIGADLAWARLGRLTATQRRCIEDLIRAVSEQVEP